MVQETKKRVKFIFVPHSNIFIMNPKILINNIKKSIIFNDDRYLVKKKFKLLIQMEIFLLLKNELIICPSSGKGHKKSGSPHEYVRKVALRIIYTE